ncbi:ornithine decarboxylase-like [Phymastichus coffea]|uniref:ornithine decarboxylase-like n=1 Tax=Phymastichus coffea TaxID=108790 RepID=UPI00273A912F|nr:ornithine decarboxylase-like [Phymastichus coffea]
MNRSFKEVKLCEDDLSDLEMLRNIIDERGGEDPLHILNLGDVLEKHRVWIRKMPRVVPYFAIKSNPNPTVIKLLASIGGHFDCASKEEIIQATSLGVPSERIIFANPIKFKSHIEYAKKVGVMLMTVDHEDELKKIKEIYPEAKILIRIRCDAKVTDAVLGKKFGCDPEDEAVNLIKLTIELDLELNGFCFHTGSPCGEVAAICRGIYICNKLIHIARSFGCDHVNIIDIGGGFPGERDCDLGEFAEPINAALDDIDFSIKIIAEPGRYYVTSAVTAAACVLGKKTVIREGKKTFMYYVSDGVYGSFIEELLDIRARHPVTVNATRVDKEKYPSTVWGPTCDSYDCLLKEELLSEYYIGDWLAWYNVGSYGTCLANEFNGFRAPKVYPVMKRKDWYSLNN